MSEVAFAAGTVLASREVCSCQPQTLSSISMASRIRKRGLAFRRKVSHGGFSLHRVERIGTPRDRVRPNRHLHGRAL